MRHRPLVIMMCVLAWTGCERSEQKTSTSPQAGPPVVVVTDLELPEPIDLLGADSADEVPSRVMDVSEARIWPACHTLFEKLGEPRQIMKVEDEAEHAEMMWGCEMEAYARGKHGERYYAYGLKAEDRLRAADQRIVAYDASGKLLWHHTIDRDSDPLNFASSRRSSFIVEFDPYLVCAGTRWDGSLEYLCAKKQEEGQIAWKGKLSQWSGTNPVGNAKSITFGDITSIKKIYPWEAVERASLPLDGTGGYSAIYATDGTYYVFSANRVPWKTLTGVDLEAMAPIWERRFEDPFDPLWTHSFARHGLTLLRQNERLIAIETRTGEVLWSMQAGPDAPPIAASEDTIYVLLRRAKGPNLVHAIEPKTGKIKWYAAPPTGTLDIAHEGGVLLLKSIRSVQRARIQAEPVR